MPSHPRAFLANEKRQVWALRRDNGDPVYLDVGQADAMREFTKEHLRCPYPGCEGQISTRGGSKRDGFFHVSSTPHPTGPESENHLAAKAMLAQWLRSQVPDGATVREEETVKNPETDLHRRPDVLATGTSGRRIAFEVEYKTWSVESWRQKQAALDTEGILTVWLIGHTKIRPAADSDWHAANGVLVPELASEMARHGVPLLVVNPQTREIATLTDREGSRRFDGQRLLAWLHVDALDECQFSTLHGIKTPTMVRIERAEHERAVAAQQAEAQRLTDETTTAKVRSDAFVVWERSAIREHAMQRWGSLPPEFGSETKVSPGIDAVEAHWRLMVFRAFVESQRCTFGWSDVSTLLREHGMSVQRLDASRTVRNWLLDLKSVGLVEVRDPRRLAEHPFAWTATSSGRTLEEGRTWVSAGVERQRMLATIAAGQAAAAERQAALAAQRSAELEARRRTKQIELPDGTKRWVRK